LRIPIVSRINRTPPRPSYPVLQELSSGYGSRPLPLPRFTCSSRFAETTRDRFAIMIVAEGPQLAPSTKHIPVEGGFMRWYKSTWLSAPVLFLAVATAAAQPKPSDPDEAQVRALVKSIYARYNHDIPDMGPLPPYSPSTAAMYEQYNVLTKDEDVSWLSEFDHYCRCQDFDEKTARLLGVTIARLSPDLIDATARYVMTRGDQGKSTRIRFQKTGTWKIHDVFWGDEETSLRGKLAETIAENSIATKPRVAQKPAVAQPSVAAQPPTPTPIPVQAVSACGDNPRCAEVSTFVATVTDLRESMEGGYRHVAVTVRFRNSTPNPLFLGYVSRSGVVTDDRGNRYTLGILYGSTVRGIGEIGPQGSIDPKFALRPGESGDARFEFIGPKSGLMGTRLAVELAVREIESFPGNQWRLGREHALSFSGFGEAGAPVAATAVAAPPVAAPANSAVDEACAKRPECFSAGAFQAEITRLTASQTTPTARAIQFSVRFRNLTGKPLVLVHTTRSTLIVDDQGNRYTPIWSNITEVRGMGSARGMESDPSFVLQPAEAREATFQVQFGNVGKVRLGNVYNVDFAVEELEVFPGNQVRPGRQFAVGFHDVKTNMGGWRGLRSLIDIQIKKKSP
jgi:hypothetical protein